MNSGSTPPGGEGRDPPRPRTSFASSLFSRRAARSEPSAPPPDARRADPPSLFPSTASKPAGPSGLQPVEPSSDRNRPDAAATRHRVAGGLPPQPAPVAAADGPVRPESPGSSFDQRDSLGHAAAWAGRRQRQVRCGCVERNRDERRGQARFGYAAATRVGQGRRSVALVRAFGSQLRRAARRVHSPAGA